MAEQNGILFDRVERTACPACHAEIDVAALEPFSLAACPECGAELTVPARLANYRLLSCLGSGGMGSVYRAYDETLAREVAIKVMKLSLGSQPEFLESFRREAQAAAKLNHPNIAQIYSFGEEKGQPYIVMEYVPGKHLEDLIEGAEPLQQQLVMKIGLDIADGLQLATASNLIHGDIKPGNILMDERDSAKLVDFGIASSPDAEQTEIWGTPYYIAPEKVKREKIDFRSDMYCLGGTLYHAIAKKPPFDGEDAMAVVKARLTTLPRPLHELRPDVDPDVERIIMRMLEFDPARRYASYGDLMADIGAYLSRGKSRPAGGGG
ncbi:MAG: protein kinase, partial [Kiritimatiellae bacterium]|nr:protein kinase [Kiritimatiellia bacterium]